MCQGDNDLSTFTVSKPYSAIESTQRALKHLLVIKEHISCHGYPIIPTGGDLTKNLQLASLYDKILLVTPQESGVNWCGILHRTSDEVVSCLHSVLEVVTTTSMCFDDIVVCKLIWFVLLAGCTELDYTSETVIKYNQLFTL